MTTLVYNGLKNARYTPGKKIGQGGEGTVFEVQGNANLVVKIYNEALDKDKTQKLTYMASIANEELTRFAAWPLDAVSDNRFKICGFIMKKLDAYVPLHMLFSPLDRKKLFPDKGYNFLVHVARNLATAFHKIHELGIVIGDVNEANILINGTGMVAFIDCDSFQVKNGDKYHFCEVGIPRYTAPELLLKGSFANVVRTTNTDSFSLATLIFQLLFMGKAPFVGIPVKEEIDEEKAIKSGEFAYSLNRKNKRLNPAKHSLELNGFTPGIGQSFHNAFENVAKRPEPKQWIADLDELSKDMVTCGNIRTHYYPKTMQNCPWCSFRKNNIIFFLDDSYLRGLPELHDIEKFINGFKVEKLEIKKLTGNYTVGKLSPSPIDKKFAAFKKANRYGIGALAVLTLIACLVYGFEFIFSGVLTIALFIAFSPTQRKIRQELKKRKKAFETLKQNFQGIMKQHNTPPELIRYNQSVTNLTTAINTFKNLPVDFVSVKRKIEEKHYNTQYRQHLQQYDVRHHSIPSFGAKRKVLIYSNGIRTAADVVKLNNLKINGIGPKNIQILFDWQRHVGAGFIYKPDLNAVNYDIRIATNDAASKKQKLEVEIKSEYKTVIALKANILSTVAALERQYTDVGRKLYAAELDLKAFQTFTK